jgi:hypothetical protein
MLSLFLRQNPNPNLDKLDIIQTIARTIQAVQSETISLTAPRPEW